MKPSRISSNETYEEVATPRPVEPFYYAAPHERTSTNERKKLSMYIVFFYSLGHVLNDMCAACWFSYLLLYLEGSQRLSPLEAGIVLFCGQIFDAIATPVVGLLSDRSKGWPTLGLGRRKLWNAGGAILVSICFLGVFSFCVACAISPSVSSAEKTASFAFFASMFNVGWAAVQVSHMALVPELTPDDGERVLLNSVRYANTVLSNCSVFIAMWVILHGQTNIDYDDYDQSTTYQILSFVVLGFGGICSVLFLIGTPESLTPIETSSKNKSGSSTTSNVISLNTGTYVRPEIMTWRDWLSMRSFYQVMIVYSLTRLATNVAQVYLSFFVTATLKMDQTAIALVPLLLYIAQLTATTVMKKFARKFGRRNSMTIGALLVAASCGIMLILTPQSSNIIYAAMIVLGIGTSIVMVISVSMQADLIGSNTESGAFVYGAMSFGDKLSNGIAVLAVQFSGDSILDVDAKGQFIRFVNGFVPLVAIGLATAVCWTISFPKHLQASNNDTVQVPLLSDTGSRRSSKAEALEGILEDKA